MVKRISAAGEVQSEYATLEERLQPITYSWKTPHADTIWDHNFPDFYKQMGGKGDATMAANADFYNLVAADGWEYVGPADSLSFRKSRSWVFRRPAR